MLPIHRPAAGNRTAIPDAAYGYAHVVRGDIRLDGEHLTPGDAARITDAEGIEAVAESASELLLWEMRRD